MWNNEIPYASDDDMKVGAVDSLCSLLDNRKYQGGHHSFEEILPIIRSNESYKQRWFYMVYSQMKKLPLPELSSIISLDDIPNIGVPKEMQGLIVSCTEQALEKFRTKYGYKEL